MDSEEFGRFYKNQFEANPNSTEFASILARMQETRKKMLAAKH